MFDKEIIFLSIEDTSNIKKNKKNNYIDSKPFDERKIFIKFRKNNFLPRLLKFFYLHRQDSELFIRNK